MKLRIEISDDATDEVIIRCRNMSKEIELLQNTITNMIKNNAQFPLYIGNSHYYLPVDDIHFFETDNGHTLAHTKDKMYNTNYKLYELEQILPLSFVRVSKSCILNSNKVCTIHKNLAGASEVLFNNSHKKVYASRMYYKMLKGKIEEMRFSK